MSGAVDQSPPLTGRVAGLLGQAAHVYAGTPWEGTFRAAQSDVGAPLRVALAGRVNTGKSTLLNALVGDLVAATDASECTQVVTWYSRGKRDEAYGVPRPTRSGARPGDPEPLPLDRKDGRLVVGLDAHRAGDLARIEVQLDNSALEGLVVIDTPGLGSLSPELGRTSQDFLTGAEYRSDAPDAVIYLMRQLHLTDTDFLEAFRDPGAGGVPPVNAVAVVSRADETGGGRSDAMAVARRIADRYTDDIRLRPYVQTAVPVAGLLAVAATMLTEADAADLWALARLSPAVTDELLLTADRFVAERRFLPVPRARRVDLLARLGLFGLRWALEQVRSAVVADAADVRAHLADTSGLTALRDVLSAQIVGRRDVLKADAALRLIHRAGSSASARDGLRDLEAEAEELQLGLHDFAEIRLLNDLRLGSLAIDQKLRDRMENLLGARGGSLAARLGLDRADPDAHDPDALGRLLEAEHARWRRIETDLGSSRALSGAAQVVRRTVDLTLAQLRRESLTRTQPDRAPSERP